MNKTLKGAIASHILDFETQLFTSLPATISSFDPVKQTVTASPVMLEPYEDGDVLSLAVIENVPVIFPSGGGGSLTFPLKEGDEVLLVFSSRCFDNWWDSGEKDQLSSVKRFNDYSDAIAIVGLTSSVSSVQASTEHVELKFKDMVVRLKENNDLELENKNNKITLREGGNIEVDCKDGFTVTNSSEELVSLVSNLADEVSKITTNTVFGATPINNAIAVAAIKAKIDTFL